MQLCGDTSTPVARWYFPDSVSGTLCQRHLDMWLDLADDDETEEPTRLAWL